MSKKIKIELRNNNTQVHSIESNSEILFLGCVLFWNSDSRDMVSVRGRVKLSLGLDLELGMGLGLSLKLGFGLGFWLGMGLSLGLG